MARDASTPPGEGGGLLGSGAPAWVNVAGYVPLAS